MIFKQTSMPVLVSRACTALLKAAEPRKSMICRHQVEASYETGLSTPEDAAFSHLLLQPSEEAPGAIAG